MAALQNLHLFDHYAGRGEAVIIAVSGGGDSMALLNLYRRAQLPDLPKAHVVTIDHGLRTDFGAEAALVEGYCATHNLPWRLVRWEGEKPKTGIMAAARLARYGLLADVAHDIGAKIILTGHTLDDQAETAIMRGSRGVRSNMESDVLFERRSLISRPLLGVTRAELRAHLVKNSIPFADDPTNMDLRFERARVRAASGGFPPVSVEAELRPDLVESAALFVLRYVSRDSDHIIMRRPPVRDRQPEILALRYVAAALGQFAYPAPQTIGMRLAELLDEGQNGVAFTAQRCRYMRVDGGVCATPEARHKNPQWLHPAVSPFETFCGKSALPLANALAELLDAKAFIMP